MKTVKVGDKGPNAEHANFLLLGHNVFNHQTLDRPQGGVFTVKSGKAAVHMKWWLGYSKSSCVPTFGQTLSDFLLGKKKLTPMMHTRRLARKFEKPDPAVKFVFPVKAAKWTKLGYPGQGTHSWTAPPNNWESDNAIDIGCKTGSPIVAVANGVIGPAFGPLPGADDSGRFGGLRLHLVTADDEFYYAHLKSTASGIKPGVKVKQGQSLGVSGSANGVEHLHLGEKHGNPAANFFTSL